MNDQDPEYYTTAGLMEAARVKRTTFHNHCKSNVGQIMKAKEKVPGLGLRWAATRCRKYLALCRARTARMEGRGA